MKWYPEGKRDTYWGKEEKGLGGPAPGPTCSALGYLEMDQRGSGKVSLEAVGCPRVWAGGKRGLTQDSQGHLRCSQASPTGVQGLLRPDWRRGAVDAQVTNPTAQH